MSEIIQADIYGHRMIYNICPFIPRILLDVTVIYVTAIEPLCVMWYDKSQHADKKKVAARING